MALKGTRKLIASIVGCIAILVLNWLHLEYGGGGVTLNLTTTILSIIGICGIMGYELRTQGDIDRREQRREGLASLNVSLPPFMEGLADALVGDSGSDDGAKESEGDPPDLDRRA